MRKLSFKTKLLATVAGVAVVGGSFAAVAYWTTTGTGFGTADTTAGVDGELSFVTSTIAAMYPGDSSQNFKVTVTNDHSAQSVYVTTVKAYITTDDSGCTGADFLLNGNPAPSTEGTAIALKWTAQQLAAGGWAATDNTDSIQFNNTGANQDDCKDATVTLNYAAA